MRLDILLTIWIDQTLGFSLVSCGPMSCLISKASSGKYDFKAAVMAMYLSFLLAFSSLLLINIYVYLVSGFMDYNIQFQLSLTLKNG